MESDSAEARPRARTLRGEGGPWAGLAPGHLATQPTGPLWVTSHTNVSRSQRSYSTSNECSGLGSGRRGLVPHCNSQRGLQVSLSTPTQQRHPYLKATVLSLQNTTYDPILLLPLMCVLLNGKLGAFLQSLTSSLQVSRKNWKTKLVQNRSQAQITATPHGCQFGGRISQNTFPMQMFESICLMTWSIGMNTSFFF